ncbi:MAG: hypothetical protein U0931_24950 [Vulcanimicrobiota bacterium]
MSKPRCLNLLLLISLPLGVSLCIPFMRYLLPPWLVGFFLPWPLGRIVNAYRNRVSGAIVILYLGCLTPFLLGIRLSEPWDQLVIAAAWFLMAFTAGCSIWPDGVERRRQLEHLQAGRAAAAALQEALLKLAAEAQDSRREQSVTALDEEVQSAPEGASR